MKLVVSYPTNEKRYVTEHTYQIVEREIELEVKKIYRHPSQWNGKQKNRYHYSAIIPRPDDCADFMGVDGFVRCGIDRKQNPHFKPMKMKFEGSYWIDGAEQDNY